MIDCHYRRLAADGEFLVFESTDGTRSNWDPEIQHGSPPLALTVGRAPRGTSRPSAGARSTMPIGPDGIGVTTADIFDRQGFIGTSAQTLLVQRRP
ncbi:MAG: hypothetical protein QOF66_1955 [Mycobacterium sp.]|nr:hypothetical protein [Mycobacterium sp.]MDT5053589.1 hypothetical protein [Mycobacterium sp.]